MTADQAVSFTVAAATLRGEREAANLYVLDSGAPVAILDVAERMMHEVGRRVSIRYTGLRPGEKMSEQLFDECEITEPTALVRSVQAAAEISPGAPLRRRPRRH